MDCGQCGNIFHSKNASLPIPALPDLCIICVKLCHKYNPLFFFLCRKFLFFVCRKFSRCIFCPSSQLTKSLDYEQISHYKKSIISARFIDCAPVTNNKNLLIMDRFEQFCLSNQLTKYLFFIIKYHHYSPTNIYLSFLSNPAININSFFSFVQEIFVLNSSAPVTNQQNLLIMDGFEQLKKKLTKYFKILTH